jgi:hypothetical protein
MVYDSTQEAYNDMMKALPELFKSFKADEEFLSDDILHEMADQIRDTYFLGEMIPPYEEKDVIQVLKYYAQYEEPPKFYTFDYVDKSKLDVAAIARHIWDEDMGPRKKAEYVESLWEDTDDNILRLFFGRKAYFWKQLDIEMMKRSTALWRSDAQCPADPNPEVTQTHNVNFSLWMPYSGTGSGRVYDTYRMRSAYAPGGLSTSYSYSANEHFGSEAGQVEWFRARCEEYLRVRPYFQGDLYPLTKPAKDETTWCAAQWHRPESGDGMIQVFKREYSPYCTACFALHGIDAEKNYLFTDFDGGEFEVSGKELTEKGLSITIYEKRVAKIYLYREVK